MNRPNGESIEVLLVDDDPAFARDVATMLGDREGFRWVDRSDLALEVIHEQRPRSILLDLNMPRKLSRLDEEEGLELLQRLSPEERARVVVVTSLLSRVMEERIKRLGVSNVYLKSEPASRLQDLLRGG